MRRASSSAGHPDDLAARVELVADYRRRRMAAHLSCRDVGRALGVVASATGYFETRVRPNPLIASLVRYGEALGIQPVLTLEGVEAPRPAAAGVLLACGYVGAACLSTLIAARRHLGISQQEVSARSGFTPKAVFLLEREDHEPQLGTLQSYARTLDGCLSARWEEL